MTTASIYKLVAKIGLGALALAGSLGVQASAVSGDFREELSLPFCCSPGVRVLERLAEPVAGSVDLTGTDQVSNPSGYSGHADMDLSAEGLLTLTGREPNGFADYQVAVFKISGIVFDAGEVITGLTIIDGTGIFDGQGGSSFPAPVVAFTANSVTVTYTVNPGEFNFGEGQTARFQLVTSSQVPEPMTIGLVFAALAGLGIGRRRALTRS